MNNLPNKFDWDRFGRKLLAAYKARTPIDGLAGEMRIRTRQRLHAMIDYWLERETRPRLKDGRPLGKRSVDLIDRMVDRHGADVDAVVGDVLNQFLEDNTRKVGKRTLIEVVAWMTGCDNPLPKRNKEGYLK
jgi:hypothetical protein